MSYIEMIKAKRNGRWWQRQYCVVDLLHNRGFNFIWFYFILYIIGWPDNSNFLALREFLGYRNFMLNLGVGSGKWKWSGQASDGKQSGVFKQGP